MQAVGAIAEELEEVEVAEDLELLADFVGDVGGQYLREVISKPGVAQKGTRRA